MLLFLRGVSWGEPSLGRSDPVHLISDPPVNVLLTGRLLVDARARDESCSALLAVSRINSRRHEGLTELIFRHCPKPSLQGWHVWVEGFLRRPSTGPNLLPNGEAEWLSAQGSWVKSFWPRVQKLISEGLGLALLADRGQPMLLRAGNQRWPLFP